MEYEDNFVPKLMKLTNIINSHKFKIGRYKCFPVTKPKLREVWAAPFKDRIVHHLIHNALREEFEKHFTILLILTILLTGCAKEVYKCGI